LVTALLLIALPALSSITPAEADEYAFRQEETVILEPSSSIFVHNISGNITVQGWDEDEVLVKYTKRVKARSRREAEEWAEKVEVIIEKSDRDLLIEAKRPREWTESLGSLIKGIFEKRPSVNLDFEIYAPPQMHLETSSVSGDIYIDSIMGDVMVDAVSGDVEISQSGADVIINIVSGDMILEDISGDVDIDAVSGDAEITRVGGDLRIDITSGDIEGDRILGDLSIDGTSGDVVVRDIHGDISIDVTSGDIVVRQKAGDLWIDTSSGDVTVETNMVKAGRYEVETSSGQISFRIPSDASSSVELETSGGRIKAKLPMTIESMSRTHLVGILGDGEGEIVLSTSGGDIELLPLD
jgi:hypothetical protein